MTTPSFWRTCILEALEHHGGEAELQQIYLWIESSDYIVDQTLWQDGGPNYQHTVRSFLNTMRDTGEIVRTERGLYRIP